MAEAVNQIETEITPQMIEAGIDALYEHEIDDVGSRIVVQLIFEQMMRARRSD